METDTEPMAVLRAHTTAAAERQADIIEVADMVNIS